MVPIFANLRESYEELWATMVIRPEWSDRINDAAKGIFQSKGQYRAVEDLTGVPWFLIGLIHQMEATRDFKTHLHNGDPLNARTSHVPAGRPTTGRPPFAWAESAADAIRMEGLDQVLDWSLERVAYQLERYNGFRSRLEHNINTPYLWSGTNHYARGKFVRDNVFDKNFVSKQAGAMPIMHRLMDLDQSIQATLSAPIARQPEAQVSQPADTAKLDVFDLKELQRRLHELPLYRDDVDGEWGPNTRAAIRALLVGSLGFGWVTWPRERLITAGKQALCHLDGIDVGEIDGILGPQTEYALSVYSARKRGDLTVETWRDSEEAKPPPQPPPPSAADWPRQKDVDAFFGEKGTNLRQLIFPYPMRLAWDPETIVKSTKCHEKVREPTQRALARALDHYGLQKLRELRLDYFGGCFNMRRIRGGSNWSMHSWGIAFDFDPERNQLRFDHTRAVFARPEYAKWFEVWEEEGAVSLGRTRDYDWMHLQFARF